MDRIYLKDVNLFDVGNSIQLYGAIYSGKDAIYFIPLPDEDPEDLTKLKQHDLVMTTAELERFFNQTDLLEVEGPAKVILRKSQRQIDQQVAWRVYERDYYRCRYCGQKRPLTVDHIILWEEGGPSIDANLVSACRNCNKARGNTPYEEWLKSSYYRKVSQLISSDARERNLALLVQLPDLRKLVVNRVRSR